MGFVERRDEYRAASGEAPFKIDELFFSRTDNRGVIEAANYIFKRVSGYEWDELLQAPHKLIRHPDMPKAVFWLIWDTLGKGKPIGAYVKNKAKDGLHYWVFAVMIPFRNGYLSVRIKPSSELFGKIDKIYASLQKAEAEDGVSPEDSAANLIAQIQEVGFSDYDAFASVALMEELASRDAILGNKNSSSTYQFSEMISIADGLKTETLALSAGFDDISTVPTNMRIIAARLEPSGGAISSLSQNYWEMSEEMSRWFQNYVSGSDSSFSGIRSMLVSSQFLCGAARILNEVAQKFNKERRSLGGVDIPDEKDHISEIAVTFIDMAISGMNDVEKEAEQILRAISMMRRFILGLSSTRVMCNIESARLQTGGESLNYVIDQLELFQTNLVSQLDQIETQSHTIMEYAKFLQASEGGPKTRP